MGETLKKKLWITQPDPDEILRHVVSLMIDEEVRWLLKTWLKEPLPVIRF